MKNYEKVYTSQEVADLLRVCEMTIRRYVKEGIIKKLPIGGAIRIPESELDRMLKVNAGGENENKD